MLIGIWICMLRRPWSGEREVIGVMNSTEITNRKAIFFDRRPYVNTPNLGQPVGAVMLC